jgi:hypothetical protein
VEEEAERVRSLGIKLAKMVVDVEKNVAVVEDETVRIRRLWLR